MTNTSVQVRSEEERDNHLAEITKLTSSEIAVIKRTVAKNTTDTELAYFLFKAKSLGLNPLNHEVWCYKDNKGNLLVFTGRDGFLVKAMRDPRYDGMRSATVRKNDVFNMDASTGSISHTIQFMTQAERGPIVGAWAQVFMKDPIDKQPMKSAPFWAAWETYNKPFGVWKTHPDEMIQKCAESHSLKKTLGLSGLEVDEDYYVNEAGIATPVTDESVRRSNQPEAAPLSDLEILVDGLKTRVRQGWAAYNGPDKKELRQQCALKSQSGELDVEFWEGMVKKVCGETSNQQS